MALLLAVALALALAVAVALALASLPYPTRKSCGTSHLETQAGSRVEETRGPSGAPRSGAKRRGKRACPSTWMCELRSGLDPASTAGNRARRMRGRRGRGVVSLGYFSLTIQREVTRPSGRNAVAFDATSDQRPATSKDRRQSPISGATSEKRQALVGDKACSRNSERQSAQPQQSPLPSTAS